MHWPNLKTILDQLPASPIAKASLPSAEALLPELFEFVKAQSVELTRISQSLDRLSSPRPLALDRTSISSRKFDSQEVAEILKQLLRPELSPLSPKQLGALLALLIADRSKFGIYDDKKETGEKNSELGESRDDKKE
jgi:hypothetical protein